MSLPAAVVAVHEVLVAGAVSHAFGGALALAYHAEPRGTVDIDVNVFAPSVDDAEGHLARLGYQREAMDTEPLPIAGIRFRRTTDPFPVDLFHSLDPAYEEIEARVQRVPFGPDRIEIPILSAEDLVMFKLSFGRDQDWVDLRRVCQAQPDLDVGYVERQLLHLRGPHMHPRLTRLRSLLSDR